MWLRAKSSDFISTDVSNKEEGKKKEFLSREADLNHRPKDHCLDNQLQSSALPAELSRVGCKWLVNTCSDFSTVCEIILNFVMTCVM